MLTKWLVRRLEKRGLILVRENQWRQELELAIRLAYQHHCWYGPSEALEKVLVDAVVDLAKRGVPERL